MTGEEWLRTINRAAAKTREGKLRWEFLEGAAGCRAVVGQFSLQLTYALLADQPEPKPRPGTLRLTVRTPNGQAIADLDEQQLERCGGRVAAASLAALFEAVVVEPRRQALKSFRDALEEL